MGQKYKNEQIGEKVLTKRIVSNIINKLTRDESYGEGGSQTFFT
jgi:hypothetical protein